MVFRNILIVVVGLCMESDIFCPIMVINCYVSLHFVLGWISVEFKESFDIIVVGVVDVELFITGIVDFAGVPAAFDEFVSLVEHAKILVIP